MKPFLLGLVVMWTSGNIKWGRLKMPSINKCKTENIQLLNHVKLTFSQKHMSNKKKSNHDKLTKIPNDVTSQTFPFFKLKRNKTKNTHCEFHFGMHQSITIKPESTCVCKSAVKLQKFVIISTDLKVKTQPDIQVLCNFNLETFLFSPQTTSGFLWNILFSTLIWGE